MKNMIYSLLILIFIIGCEKNSPEDANLNEMKQIRGYKDFFIESFRCGVFVPPSYSPQKKYPLVIYLHGYTDTTTWNLKWYNDPIVSTDPVIVLTPKCPKEDPYRWGDSWDPRTSPMMEKTFQVIELAGKVFNLDYERFYIYGSSMGGYGTYGVLRNNPEMFAAAYVECANGNTEIAPVLAKIPFWIFHGSNDNVVPVQGARDMYKAIQEAGGVQVRYTEKSEYAHNIWDYTSKEPTICSWILAQRKGTVHGVPDKVENLKISQNNDKKVFLQWNAPSDTSNPDNQIWYYKIYLNGNLIEEIDNTQTSFAYSPATINAVDLFQVTCVNYYFKESDLLKVK